MPRGRGVPSGLRPDWGQTEAVTAQQLLKVLGFHGLTRGSRARTRDAQGGVGPAVWSPRAPTPACTHTGTHTAPPGQVTIVCTSLWFCGVCPVDMGARPVVTGDASASRELRCMGSAQHGPTG